MNAADWSGWVPIGVDWNGPQPVLTWFQLGEAGFDDAYFLETISRCARPFNLVFHRQTALDALEEAAAYAPPPALCGIVFHLSRCGSTLVSRSLSTLRDATVVSEAPPVDALARAHLRDRGITLEEQVRWLRCLVGVIGGAAGPGRKHLILKLDAWHTLNLSLFERAFPGVPWVFVYRDPVEVLVSHLLRASYMMSCANAPDFLGIPLPQAVRLPREEYCARVLGRILASVYDHGADARALVNYSELPHAIWERIAPRFGITASPAQIDAMARAAAFNAKSPGIPFAGDRLEKQAAATTAIRAAAGEWIGPSYLNLERARCAEGICAPEV